MQEEEEEKKTEIVEVIEDSLNPMQQLRVNMHRDREIFNSKSVEFRAKAVEADGISIEQAGLRNLVEGICKRGEAYLMYKEAVGNRNSRTVGKFFGLSHTTINKYINVYKNRDKLLEARGNGYLELGSVNKVMSFLGVKIQEEILLGYIYIITNDNFPSWFKIGKTQDLTKRLSQYQTASPLRNYKYKLVFPIPLSNIAKVEKDLLEEFSYLYETKGEWLYTTDEDELLEEVQDYLRRTPK